MVEMITFSALVNIVLFSSLSVILLSIVFKDNKVVLKLDIRFLLICMVIILFRLLIPVESPITNNIPVSNIYPDIYMFLKEPFYVIGGMELNILLLLKLIWLSGSVFFLSKISRSYLMLRKMIGSFHYLDNISVNNTLQKVQKEYNRKRTKKFRIVTGEFGNTPFVFGIFRPYIVIPSLSYNDDEIYFILKHEMIHYYRGDLIVKLFCEILRAVYWWNPFVDMLESLINDLLEINVDFRIMKDLPEERKLDYSECLVKMAKKRELSKIENRWILAFQKESPSAVHKRISLMLDNLEIDKKKTAKSVMLSTVILALVVFCPNVLIFEPYSIAEEDAEGTFDLKGDNSFYIQNQDGTYSLYLNGQYEITVTEIPNDESVKVFDCLDDAIN